MKLVIAVCTANRDAYLGTLLAHLARIDFSMFAGFQISLLVVDNRPGGTTAALCARAREHFPIGIELVEEPEPGISQARNRAVATALAQGADFLDFLDDDDLPDPGWLVGLVERQRETGADIVMGCRRKETRERRLAAVTAASEAGQQEAPLWKLNGLPNILGTNNVLIATPLLARMADAGCVFDPFFSPMGAEDSDFFIRARQAGATFAYAPKSLIDVRTDGDRATFSGQIQYEFKAGCARGHLVRKNLRGAFLASWFAEVGGRLVKALLQLLPDLVLKRRRARSPAKLGWACGAIYGFCGGRFNYYLHPKRAQ